MTSWIKSPKVALLRTVLTGLQCLKHVKNSWSLAKQTFWKANHCTDHSGQLHSLLSYWHNTSKQISADISYWVGWVQRYQLKLRILRFGRSQSSFSCFAGWSCQVWSLIFDIYWKQKGRILLKTLSGIPVKKWSWFRNVS